MTEFIKENFEVITIVLFALVILLSIMILGMNKYFAMYFSNKKFQILTTSDINALDGKKDFSIQIFNKNINDIRVAGFGYVYKGQNIDFYQNYIQEKHFPIDHKIVISSRDYLTAKIEMKMLATIISDINKGIIKVSTIKAYVTDSLGLSTISKSKQVRKQVHLILLEERKALQKVILEQKQKQRAEERQFRKKKQVERSIKRKELLGKWMLKIKGLFKTRKQR